MLVLVLLLSLLLLRLLLGLSHLLLVSSLLLLLMHRIHHIRVPLHRHLASLLPEGMDLLRGELHLSDRHALVLHASVELLGHHVPSLLLLVMLCHNLLLSHRREVGVLSKLLLHVMLLLLLLLLVLLLVLLHERLLLRRSHILELRSHTWRHSSHHRIDLSTRRHPHRPAGELMRHAARCALLPRLVRHPGSHGMASHAWVPHASGMTGIEVGAHATSSHHLSFLVATPRRGCRRRRPVLLHTLRRVGRGCVSIEKCV